MGGLERPWIRPLHGTQALRVRVQVTCPGISSEVARPDPRSQAQAAAPALWRSKGREGEAHPLRSPGAHSAD